MRTAPFRPLCCGLFCLVFQVMPAPAAVYRCVGDQGETAFSQLPCDNGPATRVPASAAASGSAGLRPSERAWLQDRERERRKVAKPKRTATKGGSKNKDKDRQAYRCLRKRRALDAVNAKLRAGYRAGRGAALHRRQQGYRDYLSAFCD